MRALNGGRLFAPPKHASEVQPLLVHSHTDWDNMDVSAACPLNHHRSGNCSAWRRAACGAGRRRAIAAATASAANPCNT